MTSRQSYYLLNRSFGTVGLFIQFLVFSFNEAVKMKILKNEIARLFKRNKINCFLNQHSSENQNWVKHLTEHIPVISEVDICAKFEEHWSSELLIYNIIV